MKPTSLMVAAIRSTCTPNPIVSKAVTLDARSSQVGVFGHSPVLVAVGSKQRSDVFLTVASIHKQDENCPVQWYKLDCVDQGRLEW